MRTGAAGILVGRVASGFCQCFQGHIIRFKDYQIKNLKEGIDGKSQK